MSTQEKAKKIYVTMCKEIYNNTDLSATSKIILAMYTGLPSEWNRLTTATIATTLNISVSAVRESIKKLVFLDLLSEKYRYARRREFKSNVINRNDAIVILPNEVLTAEVSSTYKITMGFIVAASLGDNNFIGGYNFNKVERIAELLNLHISSVYRHIAVLQDLGLVLKKERSNWLLSPLDEYSKQYIAKQNKRISKNSKKGKNESNQVDPPEHNKLTGEILDPVIDKLLDNIFASL